MTAIGYLQTSNECTLCVFPTCVSNHGLRLFLSFKDRWWVVNSIHLGVKVRQALRICLSVVLCVAAYGVIISTWHKHWIFYGSCWSVLLSCFTFTFTSLYVSVPSLFFDKMCCLLHRKM